MSDQQQQQNCVGGGDDPNNDWDCVVISGGGCSKMLLSSAADNCHQKQKIGENQNDEAKQRGQRCGKNNVVYFKKKKNSIPIL